MGEFLRDILHKNTHQGYHSPAMFSPRTRHKEPAPSEAEEPEGKGQEEEAEEDKEGDDEGQHGACAGVRGAI